MTAPSPSEVRPAPDALGEALARFADSVPEAGPAPAPRPRGHSVGQAALALATAALVAAAFDAEGLLAWAQRLDVGGVQSAVLSVVRPLNDVTSSLGLGAPRRGLAGAGAGVAALFGAQEDPVLAEGWIPPEAVAVAAPPSPPRVEVVEPEAVIAPGAVDAGVAEPPETDPGTLVAPGLTGPDSGVLAAGEPALPEAGPAPAAAPSFLLLGDSLIAGSLGTSLHAALERGGRFHVTHAYQLGTGLARPDVYDWMKVLPPLLERERPRFVVVSIGGNDGVNIRDGEAALDFGTARWRQVYGARVEAMMRTLAAEDTRVLWLGLPPMRDARLARRAAYLNAVFAVAARRVPRVEFLQLDMLVSPGDGRYATFMQGADGRLVRYRLDDGVHLAPAGSRAIARWVLDWVRERNR